MARRQSSLSSWLWVVSVLVLVYGSNAVPTSPTNYLSTYGTVPTQEHKTPCLTNCDKRLKRAVTNDFHFECDSTVDAIVARYAKHNPVVVRQPNLSNMITTNSNPILSYTVFPTISYFTPSANDDVDLPLVVDALITTHTLLSAGARESFNSNVNKNYDRMDRKMNYDERGHIVASRLGGPIDKFNVFPQAWTMNRGTESMWFDLEADIDKFLRNNPNRYVRFTAVLSYDDNNSLVHRASGIMVRARAYNNGVLVNMADGSTVTAHNPNTTENMYFSNDPNHTCAPQPAEKPKPTRRPKKN